MSAWRRILLALGCILLTLTCYVLYGALTYAIMQRGQGLFELLKQSLMVFPVYLMFMLPVWLLSIPFILWLKDAEGWRGWASAAVGILFGPTLFAISLPRVSGTVSQALGSASAALMFSIPTTAFYIAALKLHSRHLRTKAKE